MQGMRTKSTSDFKTTVAVTSRVRSSQLFTQYVRTVSRLRHDLVFNFIVAISGGKAHDCSEVEREKRQKRCGTDSGLFL